MTLSNRARRCALLAGALGCAHASLARAGEDDAAQMLSGVVVQPTERAHADLPLSTRSIGADEIAATVNATTVEDALKYQPAIFVRRRHAGDTQAPITTRTSGVGASARSLIYVDGVLLSALIGNNNSTASPRWGMVAPSEISRIDVLYGPFSAAYPGNSIGAVVSITTRTPGALEAQAGVSVGAQHFSQYGRRDDYPTYAAQAALGDRRGALSWRVSLSHLETKSQPLSYVTAATPGATSAAGTPATGAFADRNRTGAAIAVLGAGGLEDQSQDNAKLKLEWEAAPGLSVGYLAGFFGNRTQAHAESYLRDATGNPLYFGTLNIAGRAYAVPASAFAGGVYKLEERHWMQALSLHGEPGTAFRWEAIGTLYDYGKDQQRMPSASGGAPGSILDLSGTGWRTLDLKGVWTSTGAHLVTLGLHHDRYVLGSDRYNTADWIAGPRGALAAASHGKTRTEAAFLEDAIRISPDIGLTLGVRQERWAAYEGFNFALSPALSARQPKLSASRTSPKAVLAWSPDADWRVSASIARAYRFPTVGELYQSVTVGQTLQVPNPDLSPERALSSELSVQRTWRGGTLRLSLFTEDIDDALISQSAIFPAGSTTSATFVQNVDKVRSRGAEAAVEAHDVGVDGLDLSASATFVDSTTVRDAAFPAAVGKRTPQLARWRWTAVATWRASERLTLSGAARYSSRPFGQLDNADINGHTYQGFEGYFVVDTRATWRIDGHWSAAIGVDNLTNRKYFVFHPFPQRSALAELRYAY